MLESLLFIFAGITLTMLAVILGRRLWTRALASERRRVAEEIERKYAGALDDASQRAAVEEILRHHNAELCQIQNVLEQQARELALQAQVDALTGLWNRHHLSQALQEQSSLATRHQLALSCLIIDLDHFKSINDRFGHPVGDEAIQRAAEVIRETVRAQDIVCRYGGEEFVVLAPGTNIEGAEQLGERIRAAVSGIQLSYQAQKIPVTCSIGVARFDDASTNVLGLADQALYQAKRAGRNRVSVHQTPQAA